MVQSFVGLHGGGGHSVALDNTGCVWGCGLNDKGQSGARSDQDPSSIFVRIPRSNFAGVAIKFLACGWDHTLAVNVNGRLFAWGSNAWGQCGIGSDVAMATTPVTPHLGCNCERHSSDAIVSYLACGLRHSVVVTGSGCVMTAGAGKRGQLGRITAESQYPVKSFSFSCVNIDDAASPDSTSSDATLWCRRVIGVFAGSFHSGVVVEVFLSLDQSRQSEHAIASRIIAWGCNKYGQLGQDPSIVAHSNVPLRIGSIDSMFGFRVQGVASGWTHLLAWNDTCLLSWGRNCYGQLGRSTEGNFDYNPVSVKLTFHQSQGIKDVCCGSEHSLVLIGGEEECGHLFSFGWNEHGMCGQGDDRDRPLPVLIDGVWNKIGSGYGHSFAIQKPK